MKRFIFSFYQSVYQVLNQKNRVPLKKKGFEISRDHVIYGRPFNFLYSFKARYSWKLKKRRGEKLLPNHLFGFSFPRLPSISLCFNWDYLIRKFNSMILIDLANFFFIILFVFFLNFLFYIKAFNFHFLSKVILLTIFC